MTLTLDDTGLTIESFTELQRGIELELRAATGRPTLDCHSATSWLGNVNNNFSGRLAQAQQLMLAIYQARDPAYADQQSLLFNAAAIGLAPQTADHGRGWIYVDVLTDETLAVGDLVVNPEGDSDNSWANTEAVSVLAGTSVPVAVQSAMVGAAAYLPVGALEISAGPAGITAAEVPTEFAEDTLYLEAGREQETFAEFRARYYSTLNNSGGRAIRIRDQLRILKGVRRAAVQEQAGIIECVVQFDTTHYPVDTLALRILALKGGGVITAGNDFSIVTDGAGNARHVYYTLALPSEYTLNMRIKGRASNAAAQAAVDAYIDTLDVGGTAQPSIILKAIGDLPGVSYVDGFEYTPGSAEFSTPTTFSPTPLTAAYDRYLSVQVKLW